MNTNLHDFTKVFEGSEFRYITNQAAGLGALIYIIRAQDIFRSLEDSIKKSDDCARELLSQIYSLASLETDHRYEHPYDSALAAYLLALEITGSPYSESAAQLLNNTPRLWWSSKIARQVLAAERQKSKSADQVYVEQLAKCTFVYPEDTAESVADFYAQPIHSRGRSSRTVYMPNESGAHPMTKATAEEVVPIVMGQGQQMCLWNISTSYLYSNLWC